MALPVANPRVRYETAFVDDHLLVVVKPRGRVTMPGRGHDRDSLVNGVFVEHGERLARLGAKRDYGLLHRLDRATSGLVAFALRAESYDLLRGAFAERRVEKTYLTIVRGRPPRARGETRLRLKPVRRGDLQISLPDPRGLDAITHWRTLASADGRTLVECRIETGRLHQIRAHFAALGCPVEGDTVYGASGGPVTRASVARQADRSLLLHAWRLVLPHPSRRAPLSLEAPPPPEMVARAREWRLDLERALARRS